MPFSSFASIFKTGRRSVASEDYPELEEILVTRPPLGQHQGAAVDGLCALCNDEPASQEIGGTTVGDRCAERLMGVPTGSPTPYTEFGQKVYGSQHEAGIMDWLDRKLKPMSYPQGGRWSFDWCRYRHNSHCFYPGSLNGPATSFGGYPVWTPQDRGTCPRYTWESQQQCPIGAPGPNSGEVGGAPDAITAQQPQRGGLLHQIFGSKEMYRNLQGAPEPCANCGKSVKFDEPGGPGDQSECYVAADGSWECPSGEPHDPIGDNEHHYGSRKDPDFHWHFLAKWADVRAKAARIRKEGGVRIISAPTAVNPYIVAEVKGDHHTYQSTILRSLGRKSVAGWECTCAWAHYSWGRSGRWKRFEGRMCSHALATVFQAQADEMLGGRIKEVTTRPKHFENPADYTYKPPPYQQDWAVGRPAGTEGLEHAWKRTTSALDHDERPIAVEARLALEEGVHPNEVLGYLRAAGAPWPEHILTEALQQPFVARDPANELHTIVGIEGEQALTDGGERIPVEHLTHPEFDWHSGLEPPSPQLHMKSAKVEIDPQPHLNADGSPHSGVMVALVPPEQVRQALAVKDGEPPEDMHVTVGYLGHKDSVDPQALHRAMSSFATEAPPLKGKVSGFGNFEVDPDRNDGNTHCHVGLVDIPGIAEFRAKLAEHLGREGLHIDNEHGLEPHVSLAYGHEPAEYSDFPKTTDFFDMPKVTAAHGGSWTHYPLEGHEEALLGGSGKQAALGDGATGGLSHISTMSRWIGTGADQGGRQGDYRYASYLDAFSGRDSTGNGRTSSMLAWPVYEPGSFRSERSTGTSDSAWSGDATERMLGPSHSLRQGQLQGMGSVPAVWQRGLSQVEGAPAGMIHWGRGRWDPGEVIAPHNNPAANENWNATHWERLPEEEKQRQETRPLREHGLTHEKMVQNIIDEHRYGSQNQKQYEADGNWYEDQHHAIKEIARSSAQGRPKGVGTANWTRSVFGATAALSPNTLYHHNLNLAHYMAHNYHKYNHIEDPEEASESLWRDAQKEGLRSYNPEKDRHEGLQGPGFNNMGKAMMMLRGHGDPHHVLGGHKVRSFFNNLIDPTNEQGRDSVTTDRHHFGVLAGAFLGASKDPSDPAGKRKLDAAVRIFGTEIRGGKEGPNTKGSYALTASATREAHRRLRDGHGNPGDADYVPAGSIPEHWTPAHLQAGVWGSHRRDAENVFNDLKGWRRKVQKDPSLPQPAARKPVITAALGDMPNDPTTIDPEFDPYEDEPDPDLDPEGNALFWKAHDLREEVEKAKRKDRQQPKTSMLHWAEINDDDLNRIIHEVTRRYVSQPKPEPKRVPLTECGAPKVHTDDRHLGGDDGCGWGDFCPNSPRNFESRTHNEEGPPAIMPRETRDVELHPLRMQHLNMLHWSAVQGSEDIDDDTADAMDDAAEVQKDYQRQAEEAQDDWYFNQSPPPKSFDDSHTSIPVYMSALPYGTGMVRWAVEAAEEVLHDEPEGALPSTDGDSGPSELWQRQHATTAQDPISATTPDFGSHLDPNTGHENLGYPDRDEAVLSPTGFPGASEGSTINDLSDKSYSLDTTSALHSGALSQAGAVEEPASPRSNVGSGDDTQLLAQGRAWLLAETNTRNARGDQGIRDSDIAAQARQFLATGQLPEKTGAKVFSPAEQQELIQEGSDGTRASNLDRLQLEGTHYLAGADEEDPDLEGLFG